jgi:hypothetical protein
MKHKLALHIFVFMAVGVVGLSFFAHPAYAVTLATPKTSIEQLKVDLKNDFVLEPGKAEIFLNPGDTVTRTVYVTDRVPGSTTFKIGVEDIKGTTDPEQPVLILDGQTGPYSGKTFIVPAINQVTLTFGQRITIPVTITIPLDAPPGDYDSSVLVSNEPSVMGTGGSDTSASGSLRVISRLGTLIFIRVNGQAKESGNLDDLRIKGPSQLFYDHGPLTFQILFNNDGNVHLVPYGTLTIKNMMGQVVDQLPVDAYFSLPDSIRYREITWNRTTLLGRYTATVHLERGYGGLSDDKTIAFWVLPWKILGGIFAGIFILLLIVVVFVRTFEISRK